MKGAAALAVLGGLGLAAAAGASRSSAQRRPAPARVDRTPQATRALTTEPSTPGDPVQLGEAALRAMGSRPARRRYPELERFQLAAWLTVDGLYGPNTEAALRHYLPGRTIPRAVYPGTATWTPIDAAEVYTAGVHPSGIPMEVAIGDIAKDLGEVFLPGMGKHAADQARKDAAKKAQQIKDRDQKIRALEGRIKALEGDKKKLNENAKKQADQAKKAAADAKKRLDAAKKNADRCAADKKRINDAKSRAEKELAKLKAEKAKAAAKPTDARGMAGELARALMMAAPSPAWREDVAKFQAAAGIEPTGLYDSATAAALAHYGIRSPPEPWFTSAAADAGQLQDPDDLSALLALASELDGAGAELDELGGELIW